MWVADLDLPPHTQSICERLLSTDETDRSRRFHFERDRRRYAAAHGILRLLLGRYLALPPADVRLIADPSGKPHVAPVHQHALEFNLSHSAGLALYGFTRQRRIGVDLEQVRSDLAFADIAANHFSPGEAERLRALPAAQQVEAFFNCWTRHEAYLKARGCGLIDAPAHVEVAFRSAEPGRILTAGEGTSEAQWTVAALTPAPGFVGAVVVEGGSLPIQPWRWDASLAATNTLPDGPPGPAPTVDLTGQSSNVPRV